MKLKNYINISLIIITLCIYLIIFSGCNNSQNIKLISYPFNTTIKNLDPQTATTPEESTIICNTFEGLYKKDADGNYILGMAKKLQTDEKNKRYIFTLKDNIYWHAPKSYLKEKNNKIKLTAKDFMFAFRRLMDPNTNSEAASNYFFIKNAKKVKDGSLPIEKLGVTATSENTLTIDLEYESPILEKLLASTPAMPCNEDFFNHTNGRYGTSKETLMTNGPFYLSTWDQKKYRIRVNDRYYNAGKIKIIGANFSVRSKSEILDMLQKENISTAILNSEEFSSLNKKIFKSKKFQNCVVGIAFNENNPIFKNKKIKLAMALAINKEKISDSLTEHQNLANNLIPNSVSIDSNSINSNNSKPKQSYCPSYDPANAKKIFNVGIEEVKTTEENINLNSYSVLLDKSNYFLINKILQSWQKNLGIFLKVNCQDKETYEKNLNYKNFDVVVLSISSDFNSPSAILNKFLPNSPYNYMSYDIKELKKEIDSANIQESIDFMSKKYVDAEKIICKQGYFIPLYFQTEYFIFNNNVKGILFDSANRQFYYEYSTIS